MRERITSVIRVFFSPPNVCVRVSLVTLFRKKDVAAFGGREIRGKFHSEDREEGVTRFLSLSLSRSNFPSSIVVDGLPHGIAMGGN